MKEREEKAICGGARPAFQGGGTVSPESATAPDKIPGVENWSGLTLGPNI